MTENRNWRTTFSSLHNPNYRWYWISATFAAAVMQMNLLARGWLVFDLTGSYSDVGLVSFAAGVPLFILAPFGGAISDRLDKRNLIIASQVLLCVVLLCISVLIFIDVIAFWHLMIAGFLNGVMLAFNLPSRQAIVPQLVEGSQVMNAVALNSMSQNVMRVLAPGVGGVVIGFVGMAETYLIMVVLSVASVLLMFYVKPKESELSLAWKTSADGAHKGLQYIRHLVDDIREAIQYVRGNPTLLGLLIMAMVPVLFGMPYVILLVAFANGVLELNAEQSGALYSAAGIGALVGSLYIAFQGDFRCKGIFLMTSAMAFGVTLILLAISNDFYLPFVILVGVGLSNGVYMIVNNTLLLMNSAEAMHGRVMGLFTWSIALLPLAAYPMGLAMDAADPRIVFAVCGAIIVAFTLMMLLVRRDLWRL